MPDHDLDDLRRQAIYDLDHGDDHPFDGEVCGVSEPYADKDEDPDGDVWYYRVSINKGSFIRETTVRVLFKPGSVEIDDWEVI